MESETARHCGGVSSCVRRTTRWSAGGDGTEQLPFVRGHDAGTRRIAPSPGIAGYSFTGALSDTASEAESVCRVQPGEMSPRRSVVFARVEFANASLADGWRSGEGC